MASEPITPCFHCGEPCPESGALSVNVGDGPRPVCCAGCRAVAELIRDAGLGRYYRFRQDHARRAADDLDRLQAAWRHCDERSDLWGEERADGLRDLLLQVEGIHCAACAWLSRSRLEPMAGIESVQVDAMSGYARIAWDPGRLRLSRLALELARIGYRPHVPIGGVEERERLLERRRALRRLGVAGLGMMQVMMYAVGLYAGASQGISAGAERFLEWTSLVVTFPVVLYSGSIFFEGAISSLRAGRPGMDVPVALAIGAAFVASVVNFLRGAGEVYFDSVVMFVFFLTLARYVQMVQRHRNLRAGNALARLLPEWAERLDGDSAETVPAGDLVAGDRVRVRPGEPFPADGVIERGETDVDESLLTGESRLLYRRDGDCVIAGSINRSQAVTVRVEAVGEATALSAIARMMLRARAGHARVVTAAECVAGWFVIAVLVVAAGAGLGWSLVDSARVFPVVLAVLVVSCPCALALATPAALASASRSLLREGILLTRSDALEALASVNTVVFDKTGTLTLGRPEITVVAVNPDRGDWDEARARGIAAALEAHSAHPLARAFDGGSGGPVAPAVQNHSHAGLSGTVDGACYRLGKRAFVLGDAAVCDEAGIWLGDEAGWVARFEVRDALRPDARASVERLQEAGLDTRILSGDEPSAVSDVARRLGVGHWSARQSPRDKIRHVRRLQRSGHGVLMVGDGVNDAPVLAAADVSMTVQGAADLASSEADFIVTRESLWAVEEALATARRTRRVIRQNLTWATAYNLAAVPLAVSGHLAPWMAALGMSASSLLVVANAARLARAPSGATLPERPLGRIARA